MNMTKARILILFGILISLSGCYVSVEDDSHHHDFEFRQLDIVDTYGNNSAIDPLSSLAISPYISGGEFELYWDLDSHHPYFLDFYINDKPNLDGAQLIFTDFCRPGDNCDISPILYCDYQADFDVICENVDGEIQISNIGHIVSTIPQTLYLILNVLNDSETISEYQAIPVLFE